MDRLMTISEVSELLRVPLGTLRDWRLRGIGPRSFRLGKRVVYAQTDVETYVRQCMAGAR